MIRKKVKTRPKFPRTSPARKRKPTYAVVGIDLSMSSIAGAAYGSDGVIGKRKGPYFHSVRWSSDTGYFERLRYVSRAENFIHDILGKFQMPLELNEIVIVIEEPFPMGMIGKGSGAFIKQQAEINGAFMGGLLRYGYQLVFQINSMEWRKIVAEDLGITTHHSKWKDPSLAEEFNCKPDDTGKFRAKQWALDATTQRERRWRKEIPNLPDLINSKNGKIPRPEGSVAKAVQPDDVYDALAIMEVGRGFAHLEGLDKVSRDGKLRSVASTGREVR